MWAPLEKTLCMEVGEEQHRSEDLEGECFKGWWESRCEKDDEELLKMISPATSLCLVLRE